LATTRCLIELPEFLLESHQAKNRIREL